MKIKNIFTGIILLLALTIGTSASAALITDLPSSTYITDDNKDWTWASRWGNTSNAPELPTFHAGWRFATTLELDYLLANLVSQFINGGNPIESTAYWNDAGQVGVDQSDLNGGYIESGDNASTLRASVCLTGPCDTFYVRDTVSVPAPAPLVLMGLGLIGLRLARRRKVA